MRKTESQNRVEKVRLSKFIETVCKTHDLNHSYLIIRELVPIKWSQVKEKWTLYNN